jgi:CHAD domain-containing protein
MARPFAEKYASRMERVQRRLRSYVEDPNEENVHDLRTAIRRMNAVFLLLPKELRNADKAQGFLASFRKISKQNTEIRDLDIISSKIVKHDRAPAIERLSKNLAEARKSQLEHARAFALEAQKETFPILKKREVSTEELEKRIQKVANRLTARINNRLPKVLHDPTNVEELHLLRIDARRLRYVLELTEDKGAGKLVKLLESWQDVLGPIHDNDVTIDFLKNVSDSPEVQIVLNEEMADRKRNYRKFRSIAKEVHT